MTKKVLIVDDEVHIRLLLEQTLEDLEEEGVELLIATNGKEALEIIFTEHPDLVLLDIMMPEVDGFEVCNTIKNEHGLVDIHIILITARGQEFDKQKGREVGADLYLTKPFDPDVVLEKAIEILGLND